jgi:hypothetical protein
MSETFSVIFRGDILPGHTLPDVKAKVGQLFKLDDAKLGIVFSGKPVALKKNCDQATAEKIKAVLTKAGAEVEIRSSAQASAKPAAAPAQKPAAPEPPPAAPPPAQDKPAPAADGQISIAPMSGELVSEAERAAQREAPVEVTTDHIKMEGRKATFGMPEDEEPEAAPERPEIEAPDFDVAEVGADVLDEADKKVFEELDLDLDGISMAEVGADVLSEDEKKKVEPVQVEDLGADLAPVGSDMGQVKDEDIPPPPDTSHISLDNNQ